MTDITLTDSAAAKIQQLVLAEGNPDLNLRVYIIGGGCSGFQYGFAFEEGEEAGDLKLEKNGATVVIDPMSYPYLRGATIDYLEDLHGSRFAVDNPNAKTTCGCGSSFSID